MAEEELIRRNERFVLMLSSYQELSDKASIVPGFVCTGILEESKNCEGKWNNSLKVSLFFLRCEI